MNKKIFIENENKWVATDTGYKKVFASSKNLEELHDKLKKLNIENAVTMFVPSFNKTFAP